MEPIRIDIPMEERASRVRLFTRWFWMLILVWPLYVWMIWAAFLQLVQWWHILFVGRYWAFAWTQQAKFFSYMLRLNAWLTLLTDRRPYLFKDGDSGPTVKK